MLSSRKASGRSVLSRGRKQWYRVVTLLWFQVLAANDQLTLERQRGNVFSHGPFHEGTILFLPTYRLDPGSDRYLPSMRSAVAVVCDIFMNGGR